MVAVGGQVTPLPPAQIPACATNAPGSCRRSDRSIGLPTATYGEQTLYCALELSKNSWLLAVQFPGRDNPSLHPIRGGNTSGLMTKLGAARDRLTKISGQVPRITL